MIKVLVAGFKGRMGNTTTKMVIQNTDFELTGVYDPNATEKNINEILEFKNMDIPVYTKTSEINTENTDVWIDFTSPSSVYENAKFALMNKISPVIGTTGLTSEQVDNLKKNCYRKNYWWFNCSKLWNFSCFIDAICTTSCKIFA